MNRRNGLKGRIQQYDVKLVPCSLSVRPLFHIDPYLPVPDNWFVPLGVGVAFLLLMTLVVFLVVKSRRKAQRRHTGNYLDRAGNGLIGSTVYFRAAGDERARMLHPQLYCSHVMS